jgi:5'-AMP-activated protein kinase catalytic alpha subunit
VAREIHILKTVQHPHIVQLYQIIETRTALLLIMEYCEKGELFDYIVKHTYVEEA